jgi:hypothetical protein
VFFRASFDHISSVSGLQPEISISKEGSPFTTVNRTVTDLGDGIYSIALLASDTDTLGELTILAKDPFNLADNTAIAATVQDEYLTKGEFLALN